MPNSVIRRCTMKDLAAVNFVLKHPEVYGSASHDFSLPVNEFTVEPYLRAGHVYVLIDNDNSVVTVLVSENGVLFSSHQSVLPQVRGKKAMRIINEMCEWIFENTTCKKIIGYVPEPNRPARMFAIMCGFKVEHKLENAYQKNGKLAALYLVSKEKKPCQEAHLEY